MTTKKKYLLIAIIVALVLTIDLVTKALFGDIEFKTIIPHLIDFESNHGNDGAAFGIFSGKIAFLVIITILALGLIIFMDVKFKPKSILYIIGISFIFGGAVGNLIDRLALHYVRDFIVFDFFKSFPTFNFADAFLTIGVALICIYLIFSTTKDKDSKNNNKNNN